MKRHPPAVQRMVDDAAALAQVIAWEDFRSGFVVIAEPLPARLAGLAVGRGVELAAAHGDRYGRGAVWVDPDKFTWGVAEPTDDMVARFTAITLHELAHAVLNTEFTDTDAAMDAAHQTSAVVEYTADLLATWHCHRWVAAYAVFLARATPMRRAIADAIRAEMASDVARYGFKLGAVVAAVADFPKGEPLRDVLAVGSTWEQRVAERLPSLETRVAAIAEAWAPRPAGERAVA